ncbi:hypothetical protein C8R44DRAFT_883135 [Mycena epipterygia]|nr:hypothetical protein C8R44DRAFT_883135 [Mycena epipterygia]
MESTVESQVKPEYKIGNTYPPDPLPDHRGPYFDHQQSKLVQRDYRDVDGELIAPDERYKKLTEPRSKIYHIYVERLKILDRDKGCEEPWTPAIPAIPELPSSSGSTPRKRGR